MVDEVNIALPISADRRTRGAPDGRETETALKDPSVHCFMDTFKGQVLSIAPVKGTREKAQIARDPGD